GTHDVSARKPQHKVGIVYAIADDGADFVEDVFSYPAWQVAAGIHRNDFANLTSLHFFLGRSIARVEAADMAHHEKAAGCIGGIDDGLAVLRSRSHRLFQKHVLASIQGR